MFRFLMLALLLFTQPLMSSSFANAQTSSPSADRTERVRQLHKAMCEQYMRVASASMSLRQIGEPLETLLERTNDSKVSDQTKKDMRAIMSGAYSYPIAKTKEAKQKTIQNYTKTIASRCVNGRLK